ncbi:hypothetical protein, partial [Thermococcus sp.]
STGAHVFVKALYPDGFKSLGVYTVSENGRILVKLDKLEKAWNTEYRKHGKMSSPFLVITIVKNGKIAIKGISLGWGREKVVITPKFKPLKTLNEKASMKSPTAGYYEWLDDSKEKNITAVVAQVNSNDANSWGDLLYYYAAASKIGFGMYVFANSEWSQIGHHYIYDISGGKAKQVHFDGVQDAYIWMTFTYRYERWGIHIDGQTFYEEYVYIKSFDPNSLDGGNYKPSYVKPIPIDSWDAGTLEYSSSYRDPYYTYTISGSSYSSSGLDALGFIGYLEAIGKITETAAQAATLAGLFIDVNYEEISNQAYLINLVTYGESGTWHVIKKGKATANVNNMNTIPIFAFQILNR